MIFLKIGSSQPDALLTGKHLQSMSIDGSGTLQSSMGHALKHNIRYGVLVKQMLMRIQCRHSEKSPPNGFLPLMLIKATVTCRWTTNKSQAHTLGILHPGVFAVLLLNANPDDSPYYCLTGSNTACFVTLLCILEKRKVVSLFLHEILVPLYICIVYGGRNQDNNKSFSVSNT